MNKRLVAFLFFFSEVSCAMEEGESPELRESIIEKYLEELLEEVKSIKEDVQEIRKIVAQEKMKHEAPCNTEKTLDDTVQKEKEGL